MAILQENYFGCGGSIINESYILTAGHCAPEKEQGVAGTSTYYEGGVKVNVIKRILHENYSDNSEDIGILVLEKPLTFSNSIQPIELLTEDISRLKKVTIVGFGQVDTFGPLADTLKYNSVDVLSADECNRTMGIDYPGQVCYVHQIGNGACYGASGACAIYEGKLTGVTSFGYLFCGSLLHKSVLLCGLDPRKHCKV